MGETSMEQPAHGSSHIVVRRVLYGRPCANCRCYYESELDTCPVCRCKERIPIVAPTKGSLCGENLGTTGHSSNLSQICP